MSEVKNEAAILRSATPGFHSGTTEGGHFTKGECFMGVVTINGEEYVSKSEALLAGNDNIVSSAAFGKKVIVRSRNEGINAGVVVAADRTGVVLKNCRRLWYHKPADVKLSWYEGVAISGISSDTKVSCTVSTKIIVEDYSLTICEDKAFSSIFEAAPNAQN